jgi:hypothetical protein
MANLSFYCPGCHKITDLGPEQREDILVKLDPKYPARTVTIECECHEFQFIIKAKTIKLFKDGENDSSR